MFRSYTHLWKCFRKTSIYSSQTDVLLLLHGSDPFCEEYIPSKLFEYLWTKRPIIGLVWRNPQLERILNERGHFAINALDVTATAACLLEILGRWEDDALTDNEKAEPFTAKDAVTRIVSLADNLSS